MIKMAQIDIDITATMKVTSDGKEIVLSAEQHKAIEDQYKLLIRELEAFIKDLLKTRDPTGAYEDAMSVL